MASELAHNRTQLGPALSTWKQSKTSSMLARRSSGDSSSRWQGWRGSAARRRLGQSPGLT